MRFSQRNGKVPVKTEIQIADIDDELRHGLWNVFIHSHFNRLSNYSSRYENTDRGILCYEIWKDFLGKPIDLIPREGYGEAVDTQIALITIRNWFFDAWWYEVYDFIEFILQICSENIHKCLTTELNKVLEKSMSAYRVIDCNLIPITSQIELKEIVEAGIRKDVWSEISEHLNASLRLLSDRKSPDYRNSIKEAISAVEALCCKVTSTPNATLGSALTVIEQKYKIHTALRKSFNSLYGYTSDADGIRHSLTEDASVLKFEDAKFMLVACSAFINYLRSKVS